MNAGPSETRPGLDAHAAAASGLGRLLALLSIYPPGHPRCEGVTAEIVAASQQCQEPPGLAFGLTPGAFATPRGELVLDEPNRARLHQVLQRLAVGSLRIEPGVTPSDLQEFATTVLQHKARIARTTGFSQVDIREGLPASIQVVHRAFGARLPGESAAAALQDARAVVMQELADLAPADELAGAAQLVSAVVARLVERVERDAAAPGGPSTKGRALDAVLDLCAHAMKRAIEQMLAAGDSLAELGRLVQNVETAVAIAQDKESVALLLDVLQLAAGELEAPDAAGGPEDEAHACTVEELEAQVAALAAEPGPLPCAATERQEQLSILLQLARQAGPPQTFAIVAALRALDAREFGADEVRLLVRGGADLVGLGDLAAVDRLLPALAELARAAPVDELREFLLPLAAGAATPKARALLWPHVVNALLHRLDRPPGGAEAARDQEQLWQRFAGMARADQEAGLKRLLRLDFVRRGRLPVLAIADAPLVLRQILVQVLGWPEGDPLGRHLFQELQQGLLSWPGGEVLAALTGYDHNARLLVQQVLRAGDRLAEAVELQRLSLALLIATLARLPQQRRGESWIPGVLARLGSHPGAEAERILAAVLRRRFLCWPEWPAPCRRAARAALSRRRAAGR